LRGKGRQLGGGGVGVATFPFTPIIQRFGDFPLYPHNPKIWGKNNNPKGVATFPFPPLPRITEFIKATFPLPSSPKGCCLTLPYPKI